MAKAKKKDALSLEEKLEQALVPIDEQPYEVPENWCWTKIKYGFDVTSSKRIHKSDWLSEGVPFYRTRELVKLSNDGYVDNELFIAEELYDSLTRDFGKPEKDDILISGVGTIGVPYIVDGMRDFYFKDGNVIWFKNKKIFMAKYIYYLYKSLFMKNQIYGKSAGTTVDTYTIVNANETILPLPPLAEQQRIVEQIENLFAKLDEAKEKLEDTINGFQIRKVSILHNAFTGQLTKSWRENQGKLDTVYKKEELQNLTSVIGDGLHGTPCYDESGEYYFINGNNFAGKNIEIKADTKTVNTEEYEKYKKKLSAQNTVFVSINGTLGKTAFYNDEPIILGKSACYLNVLPELNKYYLRYYFETEEFTQYANEKATGSTIKNLGLKAMRELQINVPSIEEQEEIVRLLDKILYRENEAKEKAKEVLEQIDLIKKAILAKAFRGELGTNNPDEENAVELLKSILATE